MKSCRSLFKLSISCFIGIFTVISSNPVTANNSFFGKISLSPNSDTVKKTVTGYTGGSFSLASLRKRDGKRNLCIGFADPKPDHILVLEKDFPKINIKVNSGGYDTTLLIVGPDKKTVYCGDDTGKSKDASINGRNWKAGTYQIWVGSFKPRTRKTYRLSLQN